MVLQRERNQIILDGRMNEITRPERGVRGLLTLMDAGARP